MGFDKKKQSSFKVLMQRVFYDLLYGVKFVIFMESMMIIIICSLGNAHSSFPKQSV